VTLSCGGQGVELSFKLTPGQALKYRATQEMKTITKVMGKKMEMPGTSQSTYTQKIEDMKEGAAHIAIVYDGFDMKMKMNEKDLEIPDTQSMVGKTLRMRMTTKGKIMDEEGKEAPADLQLNVSNMKNVFASIYPRLPQERVRVGESWKRQEKTALGNENVKSEMTVEYEYTLKGFEKKKGYECALIESRASISINSEKNEFGLTYSGSGTVNGVTHFAYKDGVLLESTSDISMKTEVTLPTQQGSQKIPNETQQKLTIEMI
jgi:hypothetical protein